MLQYSVFTKRNRDIASGQIIELHFVRTKLNKNNKTPNQILVLQI